MTTTRTSLTRREPRQQRSRRTVDDLLEAVQLVVKRHGTQAITTNRIAEAAGVSVGSLYQYFPDKRAILSALHERHVDDVRQVMEQTVASGMSGPLEEFVRELVHGLVQTHAKVADLHEVVSSAVPASALGFETALHHTFGQVLSGGDEDRYSRDEIGRLLFVLPRLVASLVHGTVHEVSALSRDAARNEAIRTVLVYVDSFRSSAPAHY